jgi:nucleoside-diphosphate-sugar epimerase
MRVIVVGARGFVGSALVAEARSRGLDVTPVSAKDVAQGDAGAAIVYASGVASGAASAPELAFRRHVVDAARWAAAPHQRFFYISSTRVYDGAPATTEETPLALQPADADAYVASKIAGEALVLGISPRTHVLRLSNVAGPSLRSGLFLSEILRQAASTGEVALRSALDSAKDYVDVRDVAAWALDAVVGGAPRVLNLAAGRNLTHGALLDALASCTPLRVRVAEGAPSIVVPPIDVTRLHAAFPRTPRDPLAELPGYFAAFAAAR